ncbi:MAG: CoA transferase, partial [Chloroflexota bacterium]
MQGNSLPLNGIRVLDFSWALAGPLCSKWLAALGAEVIKVETSGDRADETRTDSGFAPPKRTGHNDSSLFANANTDKLSITLNMKSALGQALARRLVGLSDVVLDNFSPGVLPRWGLSYEALAAINPGIVAVSMPALGSTGPHRHYRGHGSYFQSRARLDSLVGFPGREIVDLGFAFPDGSCNPGHAAVALLAALHYRNRTGRGQRVELRQFESTIN